MVRKGQQRQRAERAATRAREEVLQDAQVYGEYIPPPRAECTPRQFYQHLDEDGRIRVEVRVWAKDGKVADFHLIASMMHLNGLEWEWRELARVDICHGHAHIHALVGRKIDSDPAHVLRIEKVEDVHNALRLSSVAIVKFARTLQEEGDQEHD